MTVIEFLDSSYTAFHACENAAKMLDEAGFTRVSLFSKLALAPGSKHYVVKNDSAIVAFRVGKSGYGFNVIASHTDSPSLHVKGNALLDNREGKRLNVEEYGGLVMYSMVDIPLKIAGRAVYETADGLVAKTVVSDGVFNIPGQAIHQNREVNDKCGFNTQVDMLPLIGDATDVYSLIGGGEIVDADLYAVPAVKAYRSGAKSEFLVSPRIDNLTSVYSSVRAIIDCEPTGVAVCACFDNEEIGSMTKQGARSSLLLSVLKKINAALGKTRDDFYAATENGMLLSADNGHAVHPAHPEKSDPAIAPVLNGGVVIKHHVNYATDGLSSAAIKVLLKRCGAAYQEYYNRSDARCGSTLGPMASAITGLNACDVGLAQLAMHSALETVGYDDIANMQKFMTAFYSARFTKTDRGVKVE